MYMDPQLQAGLERMQALMGEAGELADNLHAARAASAARDQALVDGIAMPETLMRDQVSAVSAAGHAIDMRVMRPRESTGKMPLFYWIHGGGYVLGTAEQGDLFTLVMAQALGCYAASVDYRLAPETPYPGPLEDCYEGLKYLVDNADALNIDTSRIVIGGVSAGGGLAAGLALLIRDRGAFSVNGQVLLYPMIDDRNVAPADAAHPDTLVWSRRSNLFGWQSYLGSAFGSADIDSYAAPARATDLSGLPPAYLPVGSLDLFLDENIDYARRLMAAGVSCDLHVFSGAYHGFNGFAPDADISQQCNGEVVSFVSKCLGR